MIPIQVKEMDHIVLNVADAERSLAFYMGPLGLKGERIQAFREGEVGFPSVRINEHTLIDLSPNGESPADRGTIRGNLNHFCLVVDQVDFSMVLDFLKEKGVEVITGPVSRWGARGRATSIYILDPDRNEIELRCY